MLPRKIKPKSVLFKIQLFRSEILRCGRKGIFIMSKLKKESVVTLFFMNGISNILCASKSFLQLNHYDRVVREIVHWLYWSFLRETQNNDDTVRPLRDSYYMRVHFHGLPKIVKRPYSCMIVVFSCAKYMRPNWGVVSRVPRETSFCASLSDVNRTLWHHYDIISEDRMRLQIVRGAYS